MTLQAALAPDYRMVALLGFPSCYQPVVQPRPKTYIAIKAFKVLFQCKRFKDAVGPGYIRDFRGAMQGRADKGIIITTGIFTKSAMDEASRDGALPVELIDAARLIDLMEEFEFGLEPIKTYQVNQAFFKDF